MSRSVFVVTHVCFLFAAFSFMILWAWHDMSKRFTIQWQETRRFFFLRFDSIRRMREKCIQEWSYSWSGSQRHLFSLSLFDDVENKKAFTPDFWQKSQEKETPTSFMEIMMLVHGLRAKSFWFFLSLFVISSDNLISELLQGNSYFVDPKGDLTTVVSYEKSDLPSHLCVNLTAVWREGGVRWG
jgi:hypothetical protein